MGTQHSAGDRDERRKGSRHRSHRGASPRSSRGPPGRIRAGVTGDGLTGPSSCRVLARRRSARDRHDRGDPARAGHRWLRAPPSHRPRANLDGLPGGEGASLACSFWRVDALVLAGRRDETSTRFDQLLAVRSDVGLCPGSPTPAGAGWSATSRRRSRLSRWSTAPAGCRRRDRRPWMRSGYSLSPPIEIWIPGIRLNPSPVSTCHADLDTANTHDSTSRFSFFK
jgi:hypothetical protein